MLIATIAVVGFVLILCFLLMLSSRFFDQHGETELIINNEKTYTVDKGNKLMSVLSEYHIYLPAACGGKGNCGRCKVKILKGGGVVSSLERVVLTKKELDEGFRLACQVKIREAIDIEVDNDLLMAKGFKARLVETKKVSESIKNLKFVIEGEDQLIFKAGQYIQIHKKGNKENIIRAYSLSSSPNNTKEFTLDIQLIENGEMSNHLHQLPLDSLIDISGPFGDMFVENDYNQDSILLIAGGGGLAPLKSIVSCLIESGYKGSINLFHGVRSKKHLFNEKEYRNLSKECSNFHYVPVLSEPALEDGWTGEVGLVTKSLEKFLGAEPNQLSSCKAYLCGPTAMMNATTLLLESKGLAKENIYSDSFN